MRRGSAADVWLCVSPNACRRCSAAAASKHAAVDIRISRNAALTMSLTDSTFSMQLRNPSLNCNGAHPVVGLGAHQLSDLVVMMVEVLLRGSAQHPSQLSTLSVVGGRDSPTIKPRDLHQSAK